MICTALKVFQTNISFFFDKIYFRNQLWHERCGHLNYFYLGLLYKNRLVNGLSQIEEEKGVCEACLVGKQCRLKFRTRAT